MLEYNKQSKLDELYHYGVKGMKWGVRRTPEQLGHRTGDSKNKKLSTEEYQRLGFDKRKAMAQEHGSKALSKYQEIDDKYAKQVFKALENEDFETAAKLDKAMEAELLKKVAKPLYDAGYEWVERHAGGNGYLGIQFGRSLKDTEYTEWGKRYVDDFFIDTQDKKVHE